MKKFKTNRFGVKRRMVNQEEIVDFLKHNPGTPENSIMGSIYGFFRGSTRESNKKYADCLRRALHSGKIRREEVKGRSYKFIYFINDLPKVEIKNDFVYLSKLKNKNMNQIKLESKLEFFNLSAPVEIGPLKVTLIAQVIVCEGKIDCIEFMDIENQTYMGMEISDWRKFVDMNKEWGINYNKVLDEKFEEIFEGSIVKKIIEGLK
jgi:hypothetical protein